MNYINEYNRWLSKGIMTEELQNMSESDIKECFYKELTFGTGGIRAIMGPGPNRLNIYTIRKNTEGYANYVNDRNGKAIVIAYDNRANSEVFAKEAAKVLSSHGIMVYMFESLRTTPELSFAVRYLNAFGGIVITASHNPPEYNGYKIYDNHGCQCVPRDTDIIIGYIKKVPDILSINIEENSDLIKYICQDVDEAYYNELLSVQERPKLKKEITVVYTPLHGTGYIPIKTMLSRLGYETYFVDEQCTADPNFSNVSSPNPENKKSFNEAIALAKQKNADIVIATDPDCDRLGIVVKHDEEYKYLTGNQTGAIMLEYLLSTKIDKGTLPENAIVFDTVVTSDLGARICHSYGVEVESTLTGFKFIGDKIREYQGKKIFIFGYEESYGYMIKDFTRDKDGVQSTILACEICNYYHLLGKTLVDVLNEIYEKYGHVEDVQESETLPGIDGAKKMEEIVNYYRFNDIKELEGRKVVAKEDYKLSIRTDENGKTELTLPKSNVIKLFLEDGSWVVVRPSGNEPKIKYYKNIVKEHN
ncbi:phospho-sugar mutase [Thomasclavelia ramosa]|uniref:phospho-sugar mutase n=1 Tax=Thomasclavelia ramosa TaxID=1547 RepID=UPI00191F0AA4|nr:phospho-sugar mutase [Thomasclavelia ramosa]MCR1956898.1 phospho-sugar mutase [Thomasclavelia ramosa]QQV05348.1 phospho-sugar mutase [Thomasclavelia ramosa]